MPFSYHIPKDVIEKNKAQAKRIAARQRLLQSARAPANLGQKPKVNPDALNQMKEKGKRIKLLKAGAEAYRDKMIAGANLGREKMGVKSRLNYIQPPTATPKKNNTPLHTPGLAQKKAAVNAQINNIMNNPGK